MVIYFMEQIKRKKPQLIRLRLSYNPATFYSPSKRSKEVPSTLRGLTTVFGMGTGVTLSAWSPGFSLINFQCTDKALPCLNKYFSYVNLFLPEHFDLLVLVSLTHYCAYTSSLSTSWSTRDLKRNLILRRAWRLYAFSAYPVQTWLPSVCHWHDNWYTRGLFLPVLSY